MLHRQNPTGPQKPDQAGKQLFMARHPLQAGVRKHEIIIRTKRSEIPSHIKNLKRQRRVLLPRGPDHLRGLIDPQHIRFRESLLYHPRAVARSAADIQRFAALLFQRDSGRKVAGWLRAFRLKL